MCPPPGSRDCVQFSTVTFVAMSRICLVTEAPADSSGEIEYNRKLHASTPLFPDLGAAALEEIKMTTIVGSHCNFVNRCYWFGVHCNHHEHSSTSGFMSMSYLREVDGDWASAIEGGTMTLILSHAIRTEAPDAMLAIMQADNLKSHANLVEHTIQLIRRLVNLCMTEQSVSATFSRQSVIKRFTYTLDTQDTKQAEELYVFASRLGFSQPFEELEEFRAVYMSDGKRDIESAFAGKVGSLPLGMPHLAIAIVKCQLTCPVLYLVCNTCKYVTATEVDSLKEGKSLHTAALAAEQNLVKARKHYKQCLEQLPQATRVSIVSKIDTQIVRLLFKKKCKVGSVQEVFYEAHKAIVDALGADKVPSPLTEWSPPPQVGKPTVPATSPSDLVKYTDGCMPSLDDQLREQGVGVGSLVRLESAVSGLAAGSVCVVRGVGLTDVEVCPRSGKSDGADVCYRCCRNDVATGSGQIAQSFGPRVRNKTQYHPAPAFGQASSTNSRPRHNQGLRHSTTNTTVSDHPAPAFCQTSVTVQYSTTR